MDFENCIIICLAPEYSNSLICSSLIYFHIESCTLNFIYMNYWCSNTLGLKFDATKLLIRASSFCVQSLMWLHFSPSSLIIAISMNIVHCRPVVFPIVVVHFVSPLTCCYTELKICAGFYI